MADRLRVLIADDEPPARRKVRRYVDADPEVEVVFEAADGQRALEVISEEHPDIVFLDIQMPGMDGFQVVEGLASDVRPHIVFVTAYDEYAVRAFDVHAVDYLLKPFDAERFVRAMRRAKEAVRRRQGDEQWMHVTALLRELQGRGSGRVDRLVVQAGEREKLIRVSDVDRFEADRNSIQVRVGGDTYRMRGTMAALEERLDPSQFFRVSRSTIVNADRVVELEPWGHGDYQLTLADGSHVRLSRRYRDRLDALAP